MRKFILNEAFGIFALLLLLIPQIAHTIYVFNINSQYTNPWFSWSYAVGVDLAILIFTVKGWMRTAYAYFAGTLALNLVYQFYPNSALASILICVMLSGTIFSFSHLFYHKSNADKRKESEEEKRFSAEVLRIDALVKAGVHFEAQPFLCPECNESFANAKQLNGHISGHKMKGEWNVENYGNWEEENLKRLQLTK